MSENLSGTLGWLCYLSVRIFHKRHKILRHSLRKPFKDYYYCSLISLTVLTMAESALLQEHELAEVPSERNDEEDEVVEFIEPDVGTDRENCTRHRNEDSSVGEMHEESPAIPREESIIGKPFYARYARYIKTFCLFVSFLGLAIPNELFGPAILDLAYHTKSTLGDMSYIFTAHSVGYLIGSISGGWLYDRYNKYLVLGVPCLGYVLAMVAFPMVGSIYALIMVAAAMAICCGIVETAGNAILFVLWPRKSQPYMQFLHFTYSVGAFLAPLLAKPFLLPGLTNTTANSTQPTKPDDIPSIAWAYWIGTFPGILAGVVFLACAFLKTLKDDVVKDGHNIPGRRYSTNRVFTCIMLVLFFMFFFLFASIDTVYGGFIFTFAVKSKPYMSPDNASLLTATFWGSYALARLLSVPLTKHLKPQKMLLIDIIGCLLASVILVSQAHDGCDVHTPSKLWAGTIVLGISVASTFPATFNWLEYYMEVSGRNASIVFVGACVGTMTVPVIVGNMFVPIGPCTLMYCIFALSCLCLVDFTAILLIGRHFQSSNLTSTGIEFHKKSKSPEEPPKPAQQDHDEVLNLPNEQNNEMIRS